MAKREKFEEEVIDGDGVQVSSLLNDRGQELPDPVPMKPPVDYRAEPSITEMIRMYVRRELSVAAADVGYETFEESDDFDIDDDPLDPLTSYERVFDPPPVVKEPPKSEAPVASTKVNPVLETDANGNEARKEGGYPSAPPTPAPVKEGHN